MRSTATVVPMTAPGRAHRNSSPQRIRNVLVFLVCVAVLGADVVLSQQAGVSVLAVVTVLVGATPVLVRHRWPTWAFASSLVVVVALLQFAAIYTTIALPAVICGFTLAQLRGRPVAIAASAAALPLTVGLMLVYSPHPPVSIDSLVYLASVSLPLALGVASHERRARVAALVARADAAERTREEEAKRRINEDRLHVARDVHDVVAHTLVAINVQAGVGARLFESDPALAQDSLNDIRSVSGKALTDLRSILGVLRDPESPDSLAGVAVHPTRGIAELGDLHEALAAAGVTLTLTIADAAHDLPAAIDATAFRIVQEALTNVMRHARPTTAHVDVRRDNDAVTITVDNDPSVQPSSEDTSGAGHGLRGMRERAATVGGALTAGPRAAGGWRVRAELPVAHS